MKTKFNLFLILVLLGFAGQLQAQEKKKNFNTEEGVGNALPQFAFEAADGSWVTPDVLPANQPVIVVYFDPFCEHCNEEAAMIKEKAELFEGITMIWVSWAESVKDNYDFFEKHLRDNPAKVFVVRDTKFEIDNYFGYSEVPSMYVYNAEWKRTATFRAETDPEILVSFTKK